MNKTAGYYFREIKETNKEKNNSEFNTHKRVSSLRSTATGGFYIEEGRGWQGCWQTCDNLETGQPVHIIFQ